MRSVAFPYWPPHLTAQSMLRAMAIVTSYAPDACFEARASGHPFTYLVIDTGPIPITKEERYEMAKLGWLWLLNPYCPMHSNEPFVWKHGPHWPHDENGRNVAIERVLEMNEDELRYVRG